MEVIGVVVVNIRDTVVVELEGTVEVTGLTVVNTGGFVVKTEGTVEVIETSVVDENATMSGESVETTGIIVVTEVADGILDPSKLTGFTDIDCSK